MSFIELKNIKHSYSGDDGPISVFSGLDFFIERGEYVSLLGRNGSGKSTLAKIINMIVIPDDGEIYIDGKKIDHASISENELLVIRKKIGLVFQNPDNQIISTIVEEDVAFGPENIGVPTDEIKIRVGNSLEYVGMKKYAKRAPSTLSGGQKQRVAIAGILSLMPDCIIFDESTSMLDPRGKEEVISLMKRLNREKGITVIDITHDMYEAARADRMMVLGGGRIVLDGKPADLFSDSGVFKSFGLELPEIAEIAENLNGCGYPIKKGIFEPEVLADSILKITGTK